MTTMMDLRLKEENGSTIISCDSFTDKNLLKKYLINRIYNLESIFDDIFKFPFKEKFQIIINDYEGIVLLVFEKKANEKEYYLFADDIKYLKVTDGKSIVLKSDDRVITNASLDDENNTLLLVNFINYLGELKEIIPFNFEPILLCSNLCIFDDKNNKIIIEDQDFILALPNFYKETLHKLSLNIISKSGLRIIGSLECSFNNLGCDNFKYDGNVRIIMYPGFDNRDYEIKILNLLRRYVESSNEEVNKDIFISAPLNDDKTCQFAQDCGGILFYEGEVPKSDPLNFLGKVREVKIYRIGMTYE